MGSATGIATGSKVSRGEFGGVVVLGEFCALLFIGCKSKCNCRGELGGAGALSFSKIWGEMLSLMKGAGWHLESAADIVGEVVMELTRYNLANKNHLNSHGRNRILETAPPVTVWEITEHKVYAYILRET